MVISDVLDAPILEIAREFSVANAYLPPGQFRTRLEPQAEEEFVRMLREAWKQALGAGETVTGCTVHYIDEKIDHGQIIARREVAILPHDTAESLHARIQIAEHELYPVAIAGFCEKYAPASA